MNVNALSAWEWNYVRGLFLTDGSSYVGKKREYTIKFSLSGSEEELAVKVAHLLRRTGLNPRLYKERKINMVDVMVFSRNLQDFLPNKKTLNENVETREQFLESNKLFSVEGGIPFIAGLLDGDGSLPVFVKNKDRSRFGEVYRWTWSFAQRKYPFLVDYLEGFVESLAPNSTHRYKRDNLPFSFAGSVLNINILKRGGEALLGAGIGRYSWKVAQWLTKVEEACGERRKYMRTGQIAEMLNVSRSTVKRLLKTYGIKDYVGGTGVLRKRGSRIYVSKDEFEKKLREKLLDEKERAERIGVKLTDVAKMLGVSPRSIRDLRYRGKLQVAKVSDRGSGGRGGHTYLVIPREEVERLKHELGKPVNC